MSARLSIIPAGAVTDRSLEPRDLQVLCLLGRHTDKAGWCVRSQVRMAGEISCGRSSVQRSLERLVDAGWVQKKQRGVAAGAEPGQPSASYAYRVILDREDFAFEGATRGLQSVQSSDDADDEGCPPVGTGAQPDGHPGAQPYVGTGAQPYVGTNNDPLERPHLEREREARARDSKFLDDFEARWPTAAADSRQKTAYAAAALSSDERKAALDGIGPFLEFLKRSKRQNIPAGSTYLEEKRWSLLEKAGPAKGSLQGAYLPVESIEVRAIEKLYTLAGKGSFFHGVMKRPGATSVFYTRPIEPRLVAMAQAPPVDGWVVLDRRQAAAWEDFVGAFVTVQARTHIAEGARAPWLWPPKKDGTLYTEGEE